MHRTFSEARHDTGSGLPDPDPNEQAVSEQLIAKIREEIDSQGGKISLARYMELALYAPGLGYYTAGSRKFGAAGDFVTAPEISSLFSRALGHQVAEVLQGLDGGAVLEFGAGSGLMAADLLAELDTRQCLPERYLILELSAELRLRQQQTLQQRVPQLLGRVHWLDTLPEPGFRGVVLANEVLDAMPVHAFRVETDGVLERYVRWTGERFGWIQDTPQDEQLAKRLGQLAKGLPAGYESEINLVAEPWIHSIARFLSSGVVLLLDYGFPEQEYYHPQRSQGTLMCHYRHRAHSDPFVYPGLQDITAHVNFSAIAEAAHNAGLEVAGYNTQGLFLLGNGIAEMAETLPETGERQRLQTAQELRILTMPDEMGELFKVMALIRSYHQPLQGFHLQDLRHSL